MNLEHFIEDDVKRTLKTSAVQHNKAPSYSSCYEWLKETKFLNQFVTLIQKVGEELEKEGYILKWFEVRQDSDSRFIIVGKK